MRLQRVLSSVCSVNGVVINAYPEEVTRIYGQGGTSDDVLLMLNALLELCCISRTMRANLPNNLDDTIFYISQLLSHSIFYV
jgi:hypothetical protein